MNYTDIQKTFWKGTLVVSSAALFVKLLSALYRIPYQNIAGDLGLYVYQQVYPFYAIAIAFSLYGFPLIVSKIISEQPSNHDINHILTITFLGLSSLFGIVFLAFYTFAPVLANLMNDPLLTGPLRASSYTFLFVPFLSVVRGLFQGRGDMTPTAISQIAEQMVRITLILVLTVWLVSQEADRYVVGSAAVFGGLIGSIISSFVMLFYFHTRVKATFFSKPSLRYRAFDLLWRMLKDGSAVCVTTVMLALFQLIDAFQVVPHLQVGGMELLDAKVSKGTFDRGQSLLQLGAVLATAMALPLVPFVAKAKQERDVGQVLNFTSLALKFSFIVGSAASVGLAIIIVPTNIFLYEDAKGSLTLGLLGVAILFGSIAITSSAILQGLGKINFPVISIVIALFVKGSLNIWFIQSFGITGAAITTVLSTALVAALNLRVLNRATNVFNIRKVLDGKVLLALLWMAGATFLWKEICLYVHPIGNRSYAGFVAVSSVIVGILVYYYALVKQAVWNNEELQWFPKGKRFSRWFYQKRSGENG